MQVKEKVAENIVVEVVKKLSVKNRSTTIALTNVKEKKKKPINKSKKMQRKNNKEDTIDDDDKLSDYVKMCKAKQKRNAENIKSL